MAKIITLHSFRGGTGKSTITSNMATQLASLGNRVLIIDTDIKSPGVHALFGFHERSMGYTFNDYLLGECKIEETVYDLSRDLKLKKGKLFLTPSSIEYGDIANTLISKYSYKLFSEAINALVDAFDLDYLIIDTHPGINEETLLASELSDVLFIILRPDNQDYQGAKVSTDIAKKIGVNTKVILNKVHKRVKKQTLKRQIEELFDIPVVAAFPFTEELMIEEGRQVFSQKKPRHKFSSEVKKVIEEISN